MRKYTLSLGALVLVLMLGPPSKLVAGTLNLTYLGAQNVLGSYYVAPYQVSINGTAYNLVCDDALDNVYQGEQWSATTETLSNMTGVLFSQGYLANNSSQPISQAQAYGEAAWLVSQVFSNINNATIAGEYQYALWDVFDPGFSNTSGTLASGQPGANLTSAQQLAVNAYLSAAQANWQSHNYSNFVIYTPNPQQPGQAQEFFGSGTPQAMAEPMALWSFLVVLIPIALALRWVDKTA